jgi:hypothetical protein
MMLLLWFWHVAAVCRLKAAQESGIVLAAAALHLTYLINLDTEGFEIFSWKE